MSQEQTSSENRQRRKFIALRIFGAVLITGLVLIFGYMVYRRVCEAEAALEAEQQRTFELNVMIDVQEKKVLAAAATLGQTISGREERAAADGARKAEVAAKQSLLKQAELDLRRAESLYAKEVIPMERMDWAQTAYETVAAELKVAEELKKQAAVSLKSQESLISQAEWSCS